MDPLFLFFNFLPQQLQNFASFPDFSCFFSIGLKGKIKDEYTKNNYCKNDKFQRQKVNIRNCQQIEGLYLFDKRRRLLNSNNGY